MSPEQARGQAVDARTDIWSLGCVLYEMIRGQTPFASPTMSDVLVAVLHSEPAPLGSGREVPAELVRIVTKALRKDREQRYQTARELLTDLNSLKRRLELHDEIARAGFPADLATGEVMARGETSLFVGRQPEMNRLVGYLRESINGSGRLIFLAGEPGVGKTSLADEFLRRARGQHPSLISGRGRCLEQYGTGEAYLPFLDALSALLTGPGRERVISVLQTHAPTWCLQLPAAFTSGARERLQRETIGANKNRMLRELGDALAALANSSPLVLLLEDLHWADPSSIDLLRHLSQRIRGQRLLLVGTFRPEDVELSNQPLKNYQQEMRAHRLCEEITLAALGADQLADYLNARFAPNDFAGELAVLVERQTEGHPLFATSLIEFLAERGDIAQTDERWVLARPLSELDLAAPEGVRSLIRKKIEALSKENRQALTYASVAGEEFLSTVVAKLLGLDDLAVEEQLDHMVRAHHLLQPRGEEELPDGALAIKYRFAHVLYQNVLYEDLVSKRRQLLHRQAGEQLLTHYGDQAPRIATQLAMHFERGRDFERAVEYLIHAGDNAVAIYANGEAETHYSRALGLVGKLPAEEQQVRSSGIYQKRAIAYIALSNFDQAQSDLTLVIDRARAAGDTAGESAALTSLATVLFYAHRIDEMKSRAEEATRAAEQAGKDDLRIGAMLISALWNLAYSGDLVEVKRLLERIIPTARSIGDKAALCAALTYRGTVHFFQSEYERGEDVVTEAHNLSLEVRDGFTRLVSLFFLGLCRGNLGRMSEALATLTEALKVARLNGDHFFLPRLPNCLGWIYRELQDFEKAFEWDQRGVEAALEDGVAEAEANSLINLGYNYTQTREDEKALAAFRGVEACFARDEWSRWRYNLRLQAVASEHWLSKGDSARAEDHARRLLTAASYHEARKYIATAHKLLAEIAMARGDGGVAEAELTAALDQLRTHPVPILAWRTYAKLGDLCLQKGDVPAARAAFSQAAEIVGQIAANVSDEKLRATFLTSGPVREVLIGAAEGGL
jgi:tetratricopeptide (TPR) repeat protein